MPGKAMTAHGRLHLERLKLAADVLLSERDDIPDALETDSRCSATAPQHALLAMDTVTYPYVSDLRSKGREEGRRKAGPRPGPIDPPGSGPARHRGRRGSREQIESCTDADTLSAWLDRALTAAKATDLFD